MATAVDDLKVGMWITVIEYLGEDDISIFGRKRTREFPGDPFRIMEISLPFLAVSDGREVRGLDVRFWAVQKVSEEYAAAMLGGPSTVDLPESHRFIRPKPRKRKKRKVELSTDPRACPRCGERMRLIQRQSDVTTHKRCPRCDYDAGPSQELV